MNTLRTQTQQMDPPRPRLFPLPSQQERSRRRTQPSKLPQGFLVLREPEVSSPSEPHRVESLDRPCQRLSAPLPGFTSCFASLERAILTSSNDPLAHQRADYPRDGDDQ